MNSSQLFKIVDSLPKDPSASLSTWVPLEKGFMVPVEVWYCGKCGQVWGSQEFAERCCVCSYCHKPIERNPIKTGLGISHDECWRKHCQDVEEARWNKIPIVEPKDLLPEDEFIFVTDERAEEWHEAIDEILDNCFAMKEDPPEFVEIGKKDPFPRVDFVDYAYTYANDFCEDGGDHLRGLDELEEAGKDFSEANRGFYRYESSKKRVRLKDMMEYIGYVKE